MLGMMLVLMIFGGVALMLLCIISLVARKYDYGQQIKMELKIDKIVRGWFLALNVIGLLYALCSYYTYEYRPEETVEVSWYDTSSDNYALLYNDGCEEHIIEKKYRMFVEENTEGSTATLVKYSNPNNTPLRKVILDFGLLESKETFYVLSIPAENI